MIWILLGCGGNQAEKMENMPVGLFALSGCQAIEVEYGSNIKNMPVGVLALSACDEKDDDTAYDSAPDDVEDYDGLATTINRVVLTWPSGGEAPITDDDITCEAQNDDYHFEFGALAYTWTEAASNVSVEGEVLSASETEEGQSWSCTAVLSDSNGDELDTETSETVVIQGAQENQPPVIIDIHTSWSSGGESPLSSDDINCQLVVNDPEEDDLTFSYTWTETTSNTLFEGQVLPASETEEG